MCILCTVYILYYSTSKSSKGLVSQMLPDDMCLQSSVKISMDSAVQVKVNSLFCHWGSMKVLNVTLYHTVMGTSSFVEWEEMEIWVKVLRQEGTDPEGVLYASIGALYARGLHAKSHMLVRRKFMPEWKQYVLWYLVLANQKYLIQTT